MARSRVTGGTLVLDSQGLSLYFERDRTVLNLVMSARERGAARVISAATLLEAQHPGIKRARREYALSQFAIEPLSVPWAREAAELLSETGLSGHSHALDATVAITALRAERPVALVTSDPGDMNQLCGGRVRIIRV